MAKKTFYFEDIDKTNIGIIGGNHNEFNSEFSQEKKNTDDVDVQMKKVRESTLNIIAGDENIFSSSDFHKELEEIKEIFLETKDIEKQDEVKELLTEIQKETKKEGPDVKKVQEYFLALLRILNVIKIEPDVLERVKEFISRILVKIGIS